MRVGLSTGLCLEKGPVRRSTPTPSCVSTSSWWQPSCSSASAWWRPSAAPPWTALRAVADGSELPLATPDLGRKLFHSTCVSLLQEPRPLSTGRCQFYSSGLGYLHDIYQTEVTCHSLNSKCQLKVRSNTCYCCDLYDCRGSEHPPTYYEFVGVSGCQDVLHLYRLLWASAVLNVLGLFLGIVTAAVLGAFKDMVPLPQVVTGPSAPPEILYGPAQQILAYASFCPAPSTLPACSSYPLPLQVGPASPAELCAHVAGRGQPGQC
ncbi:hypothetical protein HPG69_003622 [Diceros bicornis minor]|uniref:Transmembrane protein 255B n=1 Tax=Diceros bicornis minor TaxID=77932 RepID=A0A7J7E6F1_DICBM|nr:hypothetical protein HPG69_003622 [Diceros bicornis minor]